MIPTWAISADGFANYGPATQECLRKDKGTWKCRISECDAPTWHNENGKVILADDWWDDMVPYAGQGAGMCIEAAAVPAEFSHILSADDHQAFRTRAGAQATSNGQDAPPVSRDRTIVLSAGWQGADEERRRSQGEGLLERK